MKLLWLDLETTGLDPQRCDILEVACALADGATPLDLGPRFHRVLHFPRGWHADARDMHTASGLLDECDASRVSCREAERDLLELIPDDPDDRPILAGSSIHFDMGFLRVHMPTLAKRLHYRLYDVTAIKLFAQSLGMPPLPKAGAHRAVADIEKSVAHAKAVAQWIRMGGGLRRVSDSEGEHG